MSNLEIPIPVTFTIKMMTDKAIIAQNIMIKGNAYIREAVLPKMFTIISGTEDDISTAVVDKWVLQQRYLEENTVDIESHIEELFAL
jgi:hypothetical protein|tara:strand:+ start:485 stop:745 length:261 start_codon:yes stop_codon:yes gene_type:complete